MILRGIYNSSAPTLTNKAYAELQLDASGNLKTTLGTRISGEDQTNNLLVVEERYSYTKCSADTQIKSSAGFLHAIILSCNDAAPTAGSLIVYDNTAESGTQIFNHTFTTTPFVPACLIIDAVTTTGIYAGFTTTADVNATFIWR